MTHQWDDLHYAEIGSCELKHLPHITYQWDDLHYAGLAHVSSSTYFMELISGMTCIMQGLAQVS